MPYDVRQNMPGCSGYAVVKPGSTKVLGCHETREDANAQVAALYAAEPDMAVKSMSDSALQKAHGRLHATETVSAADAEIHHLIADEMRARGLDHPHQQDSIHDIVVTMSTVRMPVRSLSKMLGPNEVNAIAQMATANGMTFAEVAELLTANGWMLRAVPVMAEPEEEDEEEDEEEIDEEYARLTPRQIAIVEAYEEIAEKFGPFDQSASASGAHYISAEDNVFASSGLKCANCVFFHGGGACEIMSGVVEPDAVCKLWVIESGLVSKAESYDPPEGARTAAQRALRWIEEGYAGDGFTAVGAARARDLANGRSLSPDTVRRMASFFARHSVNRDSSWDLEDGKPTPWRVSWDAWGGDAGRSWATRISERMSKATDVEEGDFVRWRSSGGPAQGQIEHVMREGTLGVPDSEFSINASPDDPALLIRIWREGDDGWEATETLVGHRMSTVRRIGSLDKATVKHLGGKHDQKAHAGVRSSKEIRQEIRDLDAKGKAQQWYMDNGYPEGGIGFSLIGEVETMRQNDDVFSTDWHMGNDKPKYSESPEGRDIARRHKELSREWHEADSREWRESQQRIKDQVSEEKISLRERARELGMTGREILEEELGLRLPGARQETVISQTSKDWARSRGLRDTDDPPGLGGSDKGITSAYDEEFGSMSGAYRGDRSPGFEDGTYSTRYGYREGSEMDAWNHYTHNASTVNRAAMGLDDDPAAQARVRAMDSLIATHGRPSPPAMIRGSRGETDAEMPEMKLSRGDVFVEPKYGSWTTNVQVARRFAGAGNSWEDTDAIERPFASVTRVTGASKVKSIPGTDFEEERILPRGVTYRVTKVKDIKTRLADGRRGVFREIDVEIVDSVTKASMDEKWSRLHDPGLLAAADDRFKPAIMVISRESDTEKSLVVKQVDEQRFTLGPWYVPNRLDAHEEWTDPDELQTALWEYVRKGNREIRLQHIRDTRAGEWVEAMTLPFPMEAPLINTETGVIEKRMFPAGTVMLGVVWDDWAWDMVKAGQIRGYSIGGSSERRDEEPPIMVDLQTR